MDKPTPGATNADFATISPRTGLLSPPLTPEMDPPPDQIKVSSPVDGPPSPPTISHSRTTSSNNYTPVGENIPLTDRHTSIALADQYLMKHQEQDAKLKKFIRRFRFCIRSLSLGCSVVVIALFTSNLAVFNATKLIVVGQSPIWGDPGQVKKWPSIMLLTVAILSAVMSVVVLLSYFRSIKFANRLAVFHTTFNIAVSLALLLMWVISVSLFSMHDQKAGESDLWSWSCAKASDNASTMHVNWGQYCIEQKWCSVCGILEIAFELITIISFALVFLRRRSKKRVLQSQRLSTYLRSPETVEEGGFFYSPRLPKDGGYRDNPDVKSPANFTVEDSH